MNSGPARISVTRAGCEQVPQVADDPLREVSRLLRTYAEASDVTISIKLPDDQGILYVALETGNALSALKHRAALTSTSLTTLLRGNASL